MNPLFCPNPDCDHHYPSSIPFGTIWWQKIGFHPTKVVGPVQRYRCLFCRHSFSDRTFSLDYYSKKTVSYSQLFYRNCSGEWPCAMSRNLHCSEQSIENRLERLGRNCLAAHDALTRQIILQEDLVADGFESFDVSQFHPNNINLLCGKDSQFLYAFTHCSLNRKGRMTEGQRSKAKGLHSAEPSGVLKSFSRLLAQIRTMWNLKMHPYLTLYTDQHPVYPGAILASEDLRQALAVGNFQHERIPSTRPRTGFNPLFSVNYLDRELRKDMAAYHRETTCFVRNASNGLHRLSVYLYWHNYRKPWRVKESENRKQVHAEVAGIKKANITATFRDLFSRRRFITQEPLTEESIRIWTRSIPSPEKKSKEYLPKYAIRGYTQASKE